MRLHTPPCNQGQIVEVSYGWHEGRLYMRIYDRSDRATSASWYIADEDEANAIHESWHPVNSEPNVTEWTPCGDPDPILREA